MTQSPFESSNSNTNMMTQARSQWLQEHEKLKNCATLGYDILRALSQWEHWYEQNIRKEHVLKKQVQTQWVKWSEQLQDIWELPEDQMGEDDWKSSWIYQPAVHNLVSYQAKAAQLIENLSAHVVGLSLVKKRQEHVVLKTLIGWVQMVVDWLSQGNTYIDAKKAARTLEQQALVWWDSADKAMSLIQVGGKVSQMSLHMDKIGSAWYAVQLINEQLQKSKQQQEDSKPEVLDKNTQKLEQVDIKENQQSQAVQSTVLLQPMERLEQPSNGVQQNHEKQIQNHAPLVEQQQPLKPLEPLEQVPQSVLLGEQQQASVVEVDQEAQGHTESVVDQIPLVHVEAQDAQEVLQEQHAQECLDFVHKALSASVGVVERMQRVHEEQYKKLQALCAQFVTLAQQCKKQQSMGQARVYAPIWRNLWHEQSHALELLRQEFLEYGNHVSVQLQELCDCSMDLSHALNEYCTHQQQNG